MVLGVLLSCKSPWSRQIVSQLVNLGHKIQLIEFLDPSRENTKITNQNSQSEDIRIFYESVSEVHLLDSRYKSNLKYIDQALRVNRICKKCKIDVLLTLYGGGFALTAWLSRFHPYCIYAVGSDVLFSKGVNRWLSRLTFNSSSIVFSNGKFLAEKARILVNKAKILPLLLGIDTSRFYPIEKDSSPVRIISTRWFRPIYNNEYLIQAFALMPEIDIDFLMTFTSSGQLLNSVQSLARETLPESLQKKIEFLGGVSDAGLVKKVKHAHIYVSMSRSDGTSTSLLEALSCGLFPILSDIPQNREWIDTNENNGILVPLDQPEALANALKKAIEDKEWRERVSEYNQNLILDRACSRRNIKILSSKLESIILQKKRGKNVVYR